MHFIPGFLSEQRAGARSVIIEKDAEGGGSGRVSPHTGNSQVMPVVRVPQGGDDKHIAGRRIHFNVSDFLLALSCQGEDLTQICLQYGYL